MKNIKFIIISLLASAFLWSCEQEAGSFYDGTGQISFTSSKYRALWTPADSQEALATTSIQIKLQRGNTVGALDVPTSFVTDDDNFTVADTVAHFADGSGEAYITIDFPAVQEWEAGATYNLSLELADDEVSVSGIQKTDIVLTYDYVWKPAGKVRLTDNTFTGEIYDVDIQKADGQNLYRLVNPFATEETEQYLKFPLDEEWNALQSDFPEGTQCYGADEDETIYYFYWDNRYVDTYCSFSNNANVYTITFLLLDDNTLYTGGEIIFTWIEDYPGILPDPIEVVDYNSMATEVIAGAVSEFNSTAFYGSTWEQSWTKAVDIHPEDVTSLYKNLYYFANLYADGYGLAFYYDGIEIIIPENQNTGVTFRGKDVYISASETSESTLETFPNRLSVYSLALNFHYEDGTSLGDFVETYYYSENPIAYDKSNFIGNFILTGLSQFGDPDAAMQVSIAAGNGANTLLITGIDYAETVIAIFDAENSIMSIAPQELADFETFDMALYTTTPTGSVSTTAAMDFTFNISGKLVMTANSKADGYLLRSETLGDWID
ncbi:MAG: hypothetical protein LBV75_00735, partial [Paludibacter sp.]|nr:hypothetical protein [Paludibacter sp.]